MWFVWVDCGVVEEFVGGVDDGQFVVGVDVGVDIYCYMLVGWCGEQQVFQVVVEDVDGFFFGVFVQFVYQFEFEVGIDFDFLGLLYGVGQLFVGWVFLVLDVEVDGNVLFVGVGVGFDVVFVEF